MPTDRTIPPLPQDLISQYLAILGITPTDPSPAALRSLVTAHLTRIPFENISKIFYLKHRQLAGPPDIRLYLDGIEKHHFGGTCYSNNYHFHQLLRTLGYDVKLCGADMSAPDVHAVNIVTLSGREYLVDAGYAAPFLDPIPRDLQTDYEITLGRDRYVLKPQDALGRSRLDLYRDGASCHGYLAKPTPRNIDDFGKAIAASFSPNATFLNSLLMARFRPGASLIIHNLSLIESQGHSSQVHMLESRDALLSAIEQHFAMPREIVSQVLPELGSLRDVWS